MIRGRSLGLRLHTFTPSAAPAAMAAPRAVVSDMEGLTVTSREHAHTKSCYAATGLCLIQSCISMILFSKAVSWHLLKDKWEWWRTQFLAIVSVQVSYFCFGTVGNCWSMKLFSCLRFLYHDIYRILHYFVLVFLF